MVVRTREREAGLQTAWPSPPRPAVVVPGESPNLAVSHCAAWRGENCACAVRVLWLLDNPFGTSQWKGASEVEEIPVCDPSTLHLLSQFQIHVLLAIGTCPGSQFGIGFVKESGGPLMLADAVALRLLPFKVTLSNIPPPRCDLVL